MAMSWRTWSYFSSMAKAKGPSPSQTRAVRLAGAQIPALPRSLARGNCTHQDASFAIRPEIENESQPVRKSLCFAALDSFGPTCPRIPEACAVQKRCTKTWMQAAQDSLHCALRQTGSSYTVAAKTVNYFATLS